MTEWVETEQDLEQLMLRIKQKASTRAPVQLRRRAEARMGNSGPLVTNLASIKASPDFRPAEDDRYHASDLLKYHDRYFVQNAYRAILKRDPDESGSRGYLEQLRSGEINKVDVLARLLDSPEGRQSGVVVEGLQSKAFIRRLGRLPVLGYLLQLIIALLRLPVATKETRRFESYSLAQQLDLVEHINRVNDAVRNLTQLANTWPGKLERQRQELSDLIEEQQRLNSQISQSHDEQLQRLSNLAVSQEQVAAGLAADLIEQSERLATQSTALERMKVLLEHLNLAVSLHQTRSASLLDAVKAAGIGPVAGFGQEDSPMLDSLYASFEDRFRGERKEIKEKFQVYLPYLQTPNIKDNVLDIGSGRGEWLELLKEQGIQAQGVDSNLAMSTRCKEAGLEVIPANGLEYLRTLPDKGLNAVSGFHIIEHLSFENLVAFVDEALRVLKPGGQLLLESPNPENVIVGTCNFYLDPSHLRPVPAEAMQFLLETRGFANVEVISLHPLASQRIAGDSELINRFNDIFYGPMDYGIVARKAHV